MTEMRRAVPTADEETIQEHIETYNKITELIEKKKDLMKQYKDAKKSNTNKATSRVDAQNSLFSKINNDLALIMGEEGDEFGKKGRSARAFSAAER